MNVLSIETSCDETAAAVVVDGVDVLANVVSSQIDRHRGYGGVIPELAAREHLQNITPVVAAALTESGVTVVDIDGVAVTSRPGLIPALLVGLSYAKGVAVAGGIPLIGVNHFLAHVYSCFLENPRLLDDRHRFPLLALIVSGGHTALFLVAQDGTGTILGQTLDDAAGEAFDKAAKILDLGYPGGPVIDRLAKDGDPAAVRFPRGLTGEGGKPVPEDKRFSFSFSGLKTSLLYHVNNRNLADQERRDIVASYQEAIVDVLTRKTLDAAAAANASTILLCGGVACNSALRDRLATAARNAGEQLVIAPPKYCTDNAAMVGGLGFHYLHWGVASGCALEAQPRLGSDFGTIPFAPDAPRRPVA